MLLVLCRLDTEYVFVCTGYELAKNALNKRAKDAAVSAAEKDLAEEEAL